MSFVIYYLLFVTCHLSPSVFCYLLSAGDSESQNKVAFGWSVRYRKGFGLSVFSVFDGEFEGRSPLQLAGGGGGSPPPQDMQGGSGGPPSKINYLMSVSVRFGICFGSVGFALKPYMKPTLLAERALSTVG